MYAYIMVLGLSCNLIFWISAYGSTQNLVGYCLCSCCQYQCSAKFWHVLQAQKKGILILLSAMFHLIVAVYLRSDNTLKWRKDLNCNVFRSIAYCSAIYYQTEHLLTPRHP